MIRDSAAMRIGRAHAVPRRRPQRSIFVTGLPSSGTTLVQQILTAHSRVGDGGEVNLMQPALIPTLGLSFDRRAGLSDAARPATIRGAMSPATMPISSTCAFAAPGLVVDKSLSYSLLVGPAAAQPAERPNDPAAARSRGHRFVLLPHLFHLARGVELVACRHRPPFPHRKSPVRPLAALFGEAYSASSRTSNWSASRSRGSSASSTTCGSSRKRRLRGFPSQPDQPSRPPASSRFASPFRRRASARPRPTAR